MLELKLTKDSLFFRILEASLNLFDVASIDCSSTGLKLQADSEHACFSLLLTPKDFKYYHCDENHSVCISIDDMVKVVRCTNKDVDIIIKIGNVIKTGNENIDTMILSFELPEITTDLHMTLVDAHRQHLDWQVLNLKHDAFFEINSQDFMHVCKFLSNMGDEGDFIVTENKLSFFSSGETGYGLFNYKPAHIEMIKPVTVTLNLEYMNFIAKACALFEEVKIALSENYPVLVECKTREEAYIKFLVASKVGSAEDKEGIAEDKEGIAEDKEGSAEDMEGIKGHEDLIKEREGEIEEEEGIPKKKAKIE